MGGPALEPSAFPRSYGVATGWKILLLLFSLVFMGAGGAMLFKYTNDPGGKGAIALAIIGVLSLALGFYIVGETLFSRIVLNADTIETHSLLFTPRLAYADIKGRRLRQAGYQNRSSKGPIELVPAGAGIKKITLSNVMASDDALRNWVNALPDLDKEEREASEAEILNVATGSEERDALKARLEAARKAAKSLTTTSACLLIIGWIMPLNIVVMIMLAVVPWLALAMAAKSPNLYSLNDMRNDARGGIGTALILPGLVMFLSACMNFHVEDWTETQLHAGAASLALLMTFLAAKIDAKLIEKKAIFLILPLLLPYAYGSIILTDAMLDGSKPQTFEAHVISKHYTGGRGAHPELTIGSWGHHDGGSVPVDTWTYNTVSAGSTVCVFLRNGALNIPWYSLGPCHL